MPRRRSQCAMDMSDEVIWHIVWSGMSAYAYNSYELVPGDRSTFTSFRRQIRCLKRQYAVWYRHWQVRGILVDTYGEVLWSLTGHGYPVTGTYERPLRSAESPDSPATSAAVHLSDEDQRYIDEEPPEDSDEEPGVVSEKVLKLWEWLDQVVMKRLHVEILNVTTIETRRRRGTRGGARRGARAGALAPALRAAPFTITPPLARLRGPPWPLPRRAALLRRAQCGPRPFGWTCRTGVGPGGQRANNRSELDIHPMLRRRDPSATGSASGSCHSAPGRSPLRDGASP